MKISLVTTLDDVRAAQPAMIYYGFKTTWWTHDPKHLWAREGDDNRLVMPQLKAGGGIPCDPRGGVLLQTDDVEGFLKVAEDNAAHYGRHGLAAFIGAHNDNCLTDFGRPWSADTFEQINEAIDRRVTVG